MAMLGTQDAEGFLRKATVTPSFRITTDCAGSDPWLDPSRVRSAAVMVQGGPGWSWKGP